MSKNKETETAQQPEEIITRYDRKMEARRLAEEKERRSKKLMKACGILVCALIVIGMVGSLGYNMYQKRQALNATYMKAGEHEITKLEYDYYYNTIVQNYTQTYSSYLGLMGIDMTKDLSKQDYSEVMTWKDFFDKMTVNQLKEVKALGDDLAAKGFTYDTSAGYQTFLDSLKAGAEANDTTEADFCRKTYGKYADVDNITPFVKENLLTAEYYTKIQEDNKPADAEVTAYYEEHKQEYDTVDYRIMTFPAKLEEDASEDEVSDALTVLSRTAEEMKEAVEAGGDFKKLCGEFAQEDQKADYEDETKDISLKEKAFYAQTNEKYSDWLFDTSRKAGDLTVASDADNRECYVLEYIGRNYDETTNETISNTLASQKAAEYLDELEASYEITDVAGKLKYLGKEDAQYAAEAERNEKRQAEEESAAGTKAAAETGSTAE